MTDSVSQDRTRSRVPKIWGRVPPRNKNFTGRSEIFEQLRAGAEGQVTAVLPRALHGMGGVGKTQVAIEYAYRYEADYDVVWWITADQPTLVPSTLAALAPHLGLASAKAAGIDDAAGAVLDALRRGEPYARWLLIYDNADNPEDIAAFLPHGPGHVLITSRNQAWQDRVDAVEVDVFTREESVAFLSRRVLALLDHPEARRLADRLGDLPLALEQAGALQSETGISVEEYLELLDSEPAELLDQARAAEYPESMSAAWRLSVSKLEEQLPEAILLLRACAFFGPEPIPVDVFRRGTLGAGPKLSAILADPILRTQIIRMLGRFALGRIDPANRTIQVHRLVQALLREDLPPAEQQDFQHEVHLLLAGVAPVDSDAESTWPRYAELVPHIVPAGIAGCTQPGVRGFANNLVRYLSRSGDSGSARFFCEDFLSRWVRDSGEDDPDVLMGQWLLGNILREVGEFHRAHALDKANIERARRVLGTEHETTLRFENAFAADLRNAGDFAAARTQDEASRALHETVLGPNHPRTLNATYNLALDYVLISDYDRGRALHQHAFVLQSEATEGVNKSDVLSSWTGLACAVRLAGSLAEARDLGEDAFDFGRQELGAENPWTLRAGRDLSVALRRVGLYDEAAELATDVYERSLRLFGDENPDTLGAAMSLANVVRSLGRIDEAYEIANSTMLRYPKVYGSDHPYNYGCIGNLGLLSRVRGELDQARELNESALAGLDAKVGRDHHYSLTIATNLASVLADLGDTAAARSLNEDTLMRSRRLLGENHPLTLGCAANLAVHTRAEGDDAEAKALIEDTLNRYARTVGPEHPDARVAAEGRPLDFDFDPPR